MRISKEKVNYIFILIKVLHVSLFMWDRQLSKIHKALSYLNILLFLKIQNFYYFIKWQKTFESMVLSVARRNQISFKRITKIIGNLPINRVFFIFIIISIHTLWVINFSCMLLVEYTPITPVRGYINPKKRLNFSN